MSDISIYPEFTWFPIPHKSPAGYLTFYITGTYTC